jgi:hypothetical protein
MKEMITSIRKFYKAMHQAEKIDKPTLDHVLKILKEEKVNWIQAVNAFNQPGPFNYDHPFEFDDDFDFVDDFNDAIDAAVMENYYDSLHETFECLKEIIALKPWEWLDNARLLSVSQPAFDMHYFISSMGHEGGDRGLVIREGYDGLVGHFNTYTKAVMTPHDFQTTLNGYTIHFTEKKFLNQADLDLIKESKVVFNNKGLLPKITRYDLSYVPDSLDPADMDDLAESLEMYVKLIKGKDFLTKKLETLPFDKIYGYFCMEAINEKPVDELMENTFAFHYAIASLSKAEANKIKKICKPTEIVLELEEFYHNVIVADEYGNERIPLVFTIIDHESGNVFQEVELLENDDKYYHMTATFLDWLEEEKKMPKTLRFTSRKMLAAFYELADVLDIELTVSESNPKSDDFRINFLNHTGSQA